MADEEEKNVETTDQVPEGAGEGGAGGSAHSPDPADQEQNVREATDTAGDSGGEPEVKDDSAKADGEEPKEGEPSEDKPKKAEPKAKKPAAKKDEKPKKDEKAKDEAKKPAAKKKPEKAKPKPPAPALVRAQAKYVRVAPRKVRLIADQVRGMHIDEARALLAFSPRSAALDIKKLIESAAANAENNHDLIADEMLVKEITVDEGPIIKRFRPRAQGRATRINKRTSHISVALSPEE